jgi:hypothetical protein
MGSVQIALLARRGSLGYVMPKGARELRSVRGLIARGILEPAIGWPGVYRTAGTLV